MLVPLHTIPLQEFNTVTNAGQANQALNGVPLVPLNVGGLSPNGARCWFCIYRDDTTAVRYSFGGNEDNPIASSFSLRAFVASLNECLARDPALLTAFTASDLGLTFGLSQDLRIKITYNPAASANNPSTGFNVDSIRFSPKLQSILGVTATVKPNAGTTYMGALPICDRLDQLESIQIRTNLPVESEYIGSARGQVITDFQPTREYSINYNINAAGTPDNAITISDPPRGSLIFNSTKERWIKMTGDAPIRRLNFEVVAILKNYEDTNNPYVSKIQIGPSAICSLKLGFYSLN